MSARTLLYLLTLTALAPGCQDGRGALSVTMRLGGPAQCLRLAATGPEGAAVASDIPVEPGTDGAPRAFTAAIYPGGQLGTGKVSLLAQGFPGPCGAGAATQEARTGAAFAQGEVRQVELALALLDPDSDGDGSPDSLDCAPNDPSRRPGSGSEFDATCGNGKDDDCDGEVDDGCPCTAGATQPCHPLGLDWPGLGKGGCKAGAQACQADGGWEPCAGAGSPTPELCNGLDDDCDGAEDEDAADAGQPCDSGNKGSCAPGTFLCSGGGLLCAPDNVPSEERCNGLDDDCDGQVDEGFPGLGQPCTNGLLGTCAASGTISCLPDGGAACSAPVIAAGTEQCNGLDDDCDGVADEGYGVGQPCTNGQAGVCLRSGNVACQQDGTYACSAAPVTPGPESCNGADDDCDGAVDDGFNVGQPCTLGQGACARSGTWACNAQGGATCTAAGGAVTPGSPTREVCDGVDNDCDGTADEQPECGGPRTDVAENASSTWAAGESANDNPSHCGLNPSARAAGPSTFYVADDTSSVLAGASAARTDYPYPGVAYVVGSYPAGRTGAWDLRTTSGLTFQYRVSLPANITVQPSPVSPYVTLCSAGGGYAAYYPAASLAPFSWAQYAIPLAGGNGWYRAASINFDASHVNSVEFQFDPSRNG
ncbi:MAG: hypothetical protein FJ086_12680, partial [Deltaproteobacteria bacterium]|nr:hypothetical protein [Deltaproteobacteria bacterium]